MTARKRLTQTFTAQSKDGHEFVIHVYTESYNASTTDASGMEPTGRSDFRTSDGKRVNHEGKGKYVIFGPSGEIPVTSDDPDAP